MKKVFYLKTCDTCKRILKELDFTGFELQDIKTVAISEDDLEQMKELAGSYEALFSRRAQNYKKLGLKDVQLTEDDIKNYILTDYTFLKRPVVVDEKSIFIGNEKKNLEALAAHLSK
jgi:arsenate reductase-like glutaredoxin family protein